MSGHNKKIALQFMEAMGTNNPALADECLSPNAVSIAMGFGKFAGVRSRDTIVSGIDAFKSIMPDGLRFDIKSVTADEERVVVEATGNAMTSEGKPYRNQYCFVFSFQDGKIANFHEYFCHVLANDVLWSLADASGQLDAEPAQ